jgi:hypothetical protein
LTNVTEKTQEYTNTPKISTKVIISILYFLLSVSIIYLIYKKTHINLREIYEILYNNKYVFILSLFSYLAAFLLKVLRWWIIVNLLYNKLFNFEKKYDFSYLLNLSSLSSILNSLGISLIISDSIKSSILALNNYKSGKIITKDRIWIFISPYLDRIIGLLSAIILAIPFFIPSLSYYPMLIIIILSFPILLNKKIQDKYKITYFLFALSMFSHIFDSFSLFLFVKLIFNLDLNFYQWFMAFILGGIGSILSVFGGLGGRTYGISFIINNIKTSLILDITYYLIQIITAITLLLISSIVIKLKDKTK